MKNDIEVKASAMAAFGAIQVAFVALVKKGVLSKADAEAILQEVTEAIKTGDSGDSAAELLTGLLERVSKSQPTRRQ